jgi:hypothetical protein
MVTRDRPMDKTQADQAHAKFDDESEFVGF